MTRLHRTQTPHTDWCAQDHRCNLAEHRSEPTVVTVPGAGSLILTRVRGATGREHAEVRLSIALVDNEPAARGQLTALLTHLRTLIGPPRPVRTALGAPRTATGESALNALVTNATALIRKGTW